jgi:hypothetical protein
MGDAYENRPFDAVEFDRILARTLATELSEEARVGEDEQTTLITSGTEGCEEA